MNEYIHRDRLIAALEKERTDRMRETTYNRQYFPFQDILGVIRRFNGEDMVPRSEHEAVVRERDALLEQRKERTYSFTEKLREIRCPYTKDGKWR